MFRRLMRYRTIAGLFLFIAVLPAALVKTYKLVEPYALVIVLVVLVITLLKYAYYRMRRQD